MNKVTVVFSICLLLLASCGREATNTEFDGDGRNALSSSFTAKLSGVVKSNTGAVVKGATVTLKSPSKSVKTTTTGTYSLSFSLKTTTTVQVCAAKSGFAKVCAQATLSKLSPSAVVNLTFAAPPPPPPVGNFFLYGNGRGVVDNYGNVYTPMGNGSFVSNSGVVYSPIGNGVYVDNHGLVFSPTGYGNYVDSNGLTYTAIGGGSVVTSQGRVYSPL